jgi:hypothetical protein
MVSNNYIEQVGGDAEDNNGIWSSTCSGTYTVVNNVIFTPHFSGWANTFGYLEYDNDASLRIYNNTFVGGTSPNVFAIDDADAIIKNNIFVGYYPGRGVYLGNDLTHSSNLDHNIYVFPNTYGDLVTYGSSGGLKLSELRALGAELNGKETSDNVFADVTGRDFSLREGSAAIDAGVNLGELYNADKDGTTRPQGNGWDIGAYEYTSNLPPVLSSIGTQTVTVGKTLAITLTATDPNTDDTLTFSKSVGSVGTLTGAAFTFTPTEADIGEKEVTFIVTDDGSSVLSDSETITITVSAAAGSSADSSSNESSDDTSEGSSSEDSGGEATSTEETSTGDAPTTRTGGDGSGSCFITGCYSSVEFNGNKLVFLAAGLSVFFTGLVRYRSVRNSQGSLMKGVKIHNEHLW